MANLEHLIWVLVGFLCVLSFDNRESTIVLVTSKLGVPIGRSSTLFSSWSFDFDNLPLPRHL